MNAIGETILLRDRFYIRVPSLKTSNGTILMLRAVYVWLKGNPSFSEIPKGYLIHHLDHDQTNDDISNLVLMCRPHHSAHHLKQGKVDVLITIDSRFVFHPVTRPKVWFDKVTNKWWLLIRESKGTKARRRKVRIYQGKLIQNREDGEAAASDIWEKYGVTDGTESERG